MLQMLRVGLCWTPTDHSAPIASVLAASQEGFSGKWWTRAWEGEPRQAGCISEELSQGQ